MTLKEIFEDVWKNTPCRSPLAPTQWAWRDTFRGRIFHCINDGWWWVKDKI